MSAARTATATDRDAVAGVLADAFEDDPVFAWCFPEPASRPRLLAALFGFMAEHLYLPHGASLLAEDAAALWRPADAPDATGFWERHGADFAAALDGHLDRLVLLADAMRAHHPVDPHAYLMAIGVRPGARGRGIGASLLDHSLGQLDAQGVPAYLEATSRRSRVLYERHGFAVVAEFAAATSPPLWSMWREPQPR